MQSYTIVICCDEKYLVCAEVTMKSIIKHADASKNYEIYLFHPNLDGKLLLNFKLLEQNNIKINFKDISGYLKDIDLYEKGYFTKAMYYRLLIPHIFKDKQKVLYLDSDLVVKADISQLFAIELSDNILAATIDICDDDQCKYVETLGLANDTYFNSGVLLFNVYEYLNNNILVKTVQFLKNNKNLRCPDQDALNVVCKNKIKIINLCWNFQWGGVLSKPYNVVVNDNCLNEYNQSKNNIKILHFTTARKPWLARKEKLSFEWWQYTTDISQKKIKDFVKNTREKHKLKRYIILLVKKIIGDKNYAKLKKFLRKHR